MIPSFVGLFLPALVCVAPYLVILEVSNVLVLLLSVRIALSVRLLIASFSAVPISVSVVPLFAVSLSIACGRIVVNRAVL